MLKQKIQNRVITSSSYQVIFNKGADSAVHNSTKTHQYDPCHFERTPSSTLLLEADPAGRQFTSTPDVILDNDPDATTNVLNLSDHNITINEYVKILSNGTNNLGERMEAKDNYSDKKSLRGTESPGPTMDTKKYSTDDGIDPNSRDNPIRSTPTDIRLESSEVLSFHDSNKSPPSKSSPRSSLINFKEIAKSSFQNKFQTMNPSANNSKSSANSSKNNGIKFGSAPQTMNCIGTKSTSSSNNNNNGMSNRGCTKRNES